MPKQAKAIMIHRLPLTQARVNLGAVVKRVRLNKEYFILEKDGIPVVGLMDIDEFEDYLEVRDPKIRANIRASNKQYLAGKSRPAAEFIKELQRKATRRARHPSKA